MRNPKVSIIVPIYNVEMYLDRCVQSLLNQTLKDIEIILVDDGSPDNCPRLCDDYARRYSHIKVVHKQNAGLGMACNSGIEIAAGEYVTFCDSDDWVDADMYQNLYYEVSTHSAQIAYTGLKRINGEKEILGFLPHKKNFEKYYEKDVYNLAMDMIASSPGEEYDRNIQVSAKVVLYNRHFLIENDLKFVSERQYPSEDLIFNVSAILKAKNIIVLPDYYYNYFINPKSISTTVKPFYFKRILESSKLIHYLFEKTYTNNFKVVDNHLQLRIARFLIGEARSQCKKIVKSTMPYLKKRDLLIDLNKDILSVESIQRYPISKLPLKYYIIHQLLVRRYFFLIIFISKLIK